MLNRMTKSECPSSKGNEQMTKGVVTPLLHHSRFVLHSSFVLRHLISMSLLTELIACGAAMTINITRLRR